MDLLNTKNPLNVDSLRYHIYLLQLCYLYKTVSPDEREDAILLFPIQIKKDLLTYINIYNREDCINQIILYEDARDNKTRLLLSKLIQDNLNKGKSHIPIQLLHDSIHDERLKGTYFVTISFKDNVNPNDTKEQENKYSSKICFKSISIYHEQRGTTLEEMGKGYHIHCIISTIKKDKAQLLNETYSTFKKFVDNKNFIDIRLIRKKSDLDNIQKYVNGEKEKDKLQKVQIDTPFKKKYNVL